nr:uncharacterized protein LOC115270937 [Aedes albopictus]
MGPASSTVNRYDRGQVRSLPLEPTPARRYSKENSQAPLLPLWGNHQSMHFNHHPGGGPYKTKPSKMIPTEASASTDATRQTRRSTTNEPRRDEKANPQDEEKKLHPQNPVACVLCNRSTTRCDDETEQAYEEAHEESRLRSTIPHPR